MIPKLKLWRKSNSGKNLILMKLKVWQSSNCDKSYIARKNPIGTKLKLWSNSNCDNTQINIKIKLWHHSKCDKTQVVTNSNCDKSKVFFWKEQLYNTMRLIQGGLCDFAMFLLYTDTTQRWAQIFEYLNIWIKLPSNIIRICILSISPVGIYSDIHS